MVSLIVSLNVVAVSDSVDQRITDIYRIGNNIPSGSAFASQVMPPSLARCKAGLTPSNPLMGFHGLILFGRSRTRAFYKYGVISLGSPIGSALTSVHASLGIFPEPLWIEIIHNEPVKTITRPCSACSQ